MTSPGVSSSSTLFMTLVEFMSWSGPQSVEAASPKCKSANSAIFKAPTARIWSCLSGAVVVGASSSDDLTVKNIRWKKKKAKTVHWLLNASIYGRTEITEKRYEDKKRQRALKFRLGGTFNDFGVCGNEMAQMSFLRRYLRYRVLTLHRIAVDCLVPPVNYSK